jgi:lactam utilization protein B
MPPMEQQSYIDELTKAGEEIPEREYDDDGEPLVDDEQWEAVLRQELAAAKQRLDVLPEAYVATARGLRHMRLSNEIDDETLQAELAKLDPRGEWTMPEPPDD